MIRDARGFAPGLGTGVALSRGLAVAQVSGDAGTNGTLYGDPVQKDGRTICTALSLWLDFRRPDGFIVCG